MVRQKALDVARAVSGVLISGSSDYEIGRVSSDSRMASDGDFFVPIKGDKFDGHDFIDDAMSNGAIGFFTDVWDEKIKRIAAGYDGCIVIKVKDSLKALQLMAKDARLKSGAKVIGITGSTGKTSTKNLITNIMSSSHNVVSSPRNFNNEIGLPLTLLSGDDQTNLFILEMGMRGKGQIDELAQIAQPEIGIITNIGDSHIGILGSRESIASAKSELMKSLPYEGFAILNADDPWTPIFIDMTEAKVVTFGLTPVADYCATNIHLDKEARANFVVHTPIGKTTIKLSSPGRHAVYNALAAIATAGCFGIDAEQVAESFLNVSNDDMRMNITPNSKGVIIINDTYNANPTSMKAALETAVALDSKGRRIAVLGDMAELGEKSIEAHYEIGKIAASLGIDVLVTVGDAAKIMKKGAIDAGLLKSNAHSYLDKNEAIDFLRDNLDPEDIVLVKASRCMEFEKIVKNI